MKRGPKDLQQHWPHLPRFKLHGSNNPLVNDMYEKKRRDLLDKKAPKANLTPFGWSLVGPRRKFSSDGP